MWANTVVASGTSIGIIIYSGPECRANMNNSTPKWKFGLIDMEVNNLTKVMLILISPLPKKNWGSLNLVPD